jgi:GLPGLI family protein
MGVTDTVYLNNFSIMKQVTAFFYFLLVALLATAQNTAGTLHFSQTIQVKIQLPDDAPEEMKKMIPPTQISQHVLAFNGQITLYRAASEEDKKDLDINHNDGEGGELQVKVMRPNSIIHLDLDQWKATESRDFMGRSFLVKDEPKSQKWKLSTEPWWRGTLPKSPSAAAPMGSMACPA